MSKQDDQIRILTEVNKKLLDLFATTIPKPYTIVVKQPALKKAVPKPKAEIK